MFECARHSRSANGGQREVPLDGVIGVRHGKQEVGRQEEHPEGGDGQVTGARPQEAWAGLDGKAE